MKHIASVSSGLRDLSKYRVTWTLSRGLTNVKSLPWHRQMPQWPQLMAFSDPQLSLSRFALEFVLEHAKAQVAPSLDH